MVQVEVVPTMINHLNPTSKPFIPSSKNPAKCERPLLTYMRALTDMTHRFDP